MMMRNAEALLERGVRAQQAGRTSEAVALYLDVLRHQPDNPHACRLLGELALHSGMFGQAVEMLSIAARLLPRDAALRVNLGAAHQAIEDWNAAERSYRSALTLDPNLIQAHGNLASVLAERGDAAAAEREYRALIAANPGFADAHVNLGNLLRRKGDIAGAITCYRQAVACTPDHAMAHNNLGGALLLSESWSEGWAEFEWRWRLGDNPALRARHRLPLWQGDDLKDRRILLWGEQGIGDVVLFATMLPDLLAAGAKVGLELDPRLVGLFQRSFPAAAVFAWGEVPADAAFDCQANLGRLGLFLRTTAQAFNDTRPYLRPDPQRVAAFRERYAALGPGPRIGIAWRSASPNHRRKSLALDDFAPLFAALPHASFVSLQYGDTRDELAHARSRHGVAILHDDSFDNWTDLDGLAAQIASLDHVVTVSNLNAHLAGAAGIPADVLVTANVLWYWPDGRPRTAWYRSLRLHHANALASARQAVERLSGQIAARD